MAEFPGGGATARCVGGAAPFPFQPGAVAPCGCRRPAAAAAPRRPARRSRASAISRLKRRRDVGRKAESIANHALDFGTPVLESALTLIEDNRLYYRGRDAAGLARTASLEEGA